jgi:hypothetical protein
MALHERLRKRLAALEPGGGRRWAEHRDAGPAQLVRQPGDERIFGPDHRRGRSARRARGATSAATSVARTGWHGASAAIASLPGAACSADTSGLWAIFHASAVLASAAAHEQDSHR